MEIENKIKRESSFRRVALCRAFFLNLFWNEWRKKVVNMAERQDKNMHYVACVTDYRSSLDAILFNLAYEALRM